MQKYNLKRRIGMNNSFKGKSLKWLMIVIGLIVLMGLVYTEMLKDQATALNGISPQ